MSFMYSYDSRSNIIGAKYTEYFDMSLARVVGEVVPDNRSLNITQSIAMVTINEK